MKKKITKQKPVKKKQKMNIGLQVSVIMKALADHEISTTKSEIMDFISPDLEYEENKKNVFEAFGVGKGKKKKSDKQLEADLFLIDQAQDVHFSRSYIAQKQDNSILAEHTYTPLQALKDAKKADKWFQQPNRYDIVGVDASEEMILLKKKKVNKSTKAKKITAKKKRGEK